MNLGIAGEVRCVITKADGSIKTDTGFQKNLILNQGLEFFGGNYGTSMFERCVIGSGNSTPVVTQNQLDLFVDIRSGTQASSKYDYVADGSNLYKTNRIYKYQFTNLNKVNISEVGLASQGNISSDYYLCTRALIKDAAGAPTVITILSGETLDVYYKLWRVVSTLDTNHVVNMLNGAGGSVPYNIKCRLARVGTDGWEDVGNALSVTNEYVSYNTSDLVDMSTIPSETAYSRDLLTISPYVPLSFKRIVTLPLSTSLGNFGIRTIVLYRTGFYPCQIRYGSVAKDSPVKKTNKEVLTFPFEFSWSRYEGVL